LSNLDMILFEYFF